MVKRQLSEQEKKFTLKNIGSLEKRNKHLEIYKGLHEIRVTDEYKKERLLVAFKDVLKKLGKTDIKETQRLKELEYISAKILEIEFEVQQEKEKQTLKDIEEELTLNKQTINTALKQVRVGVDVQKQDEVKNNDKRK